MIAQKIENNLACVALGLTAQEFEKIDNWRFALHMPYHNFAKSHSKPRMMPAIVAAVANGLREASDIATLWEIVDWRAGKRRENSDNKLTVNDLAPISERIPPGGYVPLDRPVLWAGLTFWCGL